MLPTKFRIIWPSGYRGIFQKLTIRNKNPMAAMFVNESGGNEQSL
jgi:hypothetical protein